jgi:hypothetical protein
VEREGWKLLKFSAIFILLLFATGVLATPGKTQAAEPARERLLEQALLVQLHPLIYSTLQRIYQEEFPQYMDARITSIDGAVTGVRKEGHASRVDAIGGARVYQIVIQLVKRGIEDEEGNSGEKETTEMKRVPDEIVLLTLDNDTPDGKFTVRSYEITK